MSTIYERIKNRRKELGKSVEDVAKALGVSKATVYRYESAEIEKVPAKSLDRLAWVLRTTPAYLMGWSDDPTRPRFDMDKLVDTITESFMRDVESGKIEIPYYDDETAEMAQELFDNKDLRLLFDAAKDCRPEDLQMAADLLKRLKQTNPDG